MSVQRHGAHSLGPEEAGPPIVDDSPGKPIAVVLACWMLCLVGVWAFWPFLASEYRRFRPISIAAIFLGDLLALLWFIRFVVKHASRNRLQRRRLLPTTAFGWALLGSTVLGLGVDLVFTLNHIRMEGNQYRNGEQVVARVIQARRARKPARVRYQLDVEFRDGHGTLSRAQVETWKSRENGWLEGTSPELIQKLTRGRISQVRIRYHRNWPHRAWIEGVGPHGDGIAWFSIAVICFQAIFILGGTVPFVTALRRHVQSGRVPWWHDLHDVIPLAVEAALMLFSGILYRQWEWTGLNTTAWVF